MSPASEAVAAFRTVHGTAPAGVDFAGQDRCDCGVSLNINKLDFEPVFLELARGCCRPHGRHRPADRNVSDSEFFGFFGGNCGASDDEAKDYE